MAEETLIVLGIDSRRSEQSARIIKRDLSQIKGKAREATRGFTGLQKSVDKTSRGFTSLGAGAARLGGFLGAAAVAFATRGLFKAATSINQIENSFRAATGSAGAAAAEFDFVRTEAKRLGLDIEVSALQFAKLAAAAKGTALEGKGARDIFTATAEAATVLGLSAEQAGGTLTAFEQIISKGVVSAEELRGQLGERLPGAFQIAARSMGVTTAELGKLLQLGKIAAEDLLPKMAKEMRKAFGPGLVKAISGPRAEMNRFNTAAFELGATLGIITTPALNAFSRAGAGVFEFLNKLALEFKSLDSLSIKETEQRLGKLQARLEGLQSIGRTSFLPETRQAILSVQARLEELQERGAAKTNLGGAFKIPKELTDGFKKLKAELVPLGAAQDEFAKKQLLIGDAMDAGLVGLSAASALTQRLGLAYRDILDPIGAVIRELDREQSLLKLSTAEREKATQLLEFETKLRDEFGVTLSRQQRGDIGGRLDALRETAKAQDLLNDLSDRAASIIDDARSPFERYTKTINTLTLALNEGRISQLGFTDAARDAGTILQQQQKELDTTAESARRFGSIFTDAFEDALISGNSLIDILRGLEKELQRAFLLELGVTGEKGFVNSIVGDVVGFLKGEDKTTVDGAKKAGGGFLSGIVDFIKGVDPDIPKVSFKDVGVAKVVDPLADGTGAFDMLGGAATQLTADFGLTSAASKIAGDALQTGAFDTLATAAKTILLGFAEESAATSVLQLAVAARVAAAALNSMGGSKGGGLGGLGKFLPIGNEDFSAPFDSATDIAFGGPGFLEFKHGGSALVRGAPGVDNLVPRMRVSAGELVEVKTPAQQRQGGGINITNHFNIVANNPSELRVGFRQTASQFAADMQRQLDKARRIQ